LRQDRSQALLSPARRLGGKPRLARLRRQTMKKRMRAKLKAIKTELRKRKHHTIAETGRWLRAVVQGYMNYHAVPGDSQVLRSFHRQVLRMWRGTLRKRSQTHRMPWTRFGKIAKRWIPTPRITHPYPDARFYARTQGRNRCGSSARLDLCGGRAARPVPTGIAGQGNPTIVRPSHDIQSSN